MFDKLIFGACFGLFYFLTSDPTAQQNFAQQLEVKNLAGNFITQYSKRFYATTCHEMGHAIAAKLVNNDQVNVHLGSNSYNNPKQPLLATRYIKLEGLDANAGFTYYTTPKGPHKKAKLATILLAGGIGSILGNGLRKGLLQESILEFDEIMLVELCNMFIPLGTDNERSDAAMLHTECLGTKTDLIKQLGYLRTIIDITGEYYLTYSQQQTLDPQQNPYARILLALLNRELRGYLRFNA